MLKKTITYVDYDGRTRTEDFYFNLTKAELMNMQLSVHGGYAAALNKKISNQDQPAIVQVFEELITKAYGVKSDDGRRFIKSPELSEEFKQTEAYSQLYMELIQDEKAGEDFIKAIVPAELANQLKVSVNALPETTTTTTTTT